MRHRVFDTVINEYMDIRDDKTRKGVLALNEAEQNKLLAKLASKLYDHIINKVDDIDYGEIPNTKGDFTKLSNYEQIKDCIEVIEKLLIEYKQDLTPIHVIKDAMGNIISRKSMFEMAFKVNIELPIVLYSTLSLSIISSLSLLITTCIEYIKMPNSDEFQIVLNKVALAKNKDNLLFNNLKKFNSTCKTKEFDKAMDHIIKSKSKNMLGVVDVYLLMNITVLAGLALSIIPLLRELIYFFYYSRVKISDYLEVQAELLQMNIYNIQSNEDLGERKDQVIEKQSKIVDLFKKLSNKINITIKTSENKTTKEISDDNTNKFTANDFNDNDSVLF